MYRALTIALAAAALLPAGCASLWDAVTSRKFRDAPLKTVGHVVSPEDPVMVLRAGNARTGDERAKAMHRLKEPATHGGTPDDQSQMIEALAQAATAEASPVLRFAAIEALGRFEDPRATAVLITAYQAADGLTDAERAPPKELARPEVAQIGGTSAGRAPVRGGIDPVAALKGPAGYAPDTVAALRCRCLESLGRTHKPEAARFLAAVAGAGGADAIPPGGDNTEVRQAAVRGLGGCRQPEAVVALAEVLKQQSGKDIILARQSHAGLVRLTGKRLPADPAQWDEVVQAGVTLAPEPTKFESAVQSAIFWDKTK